MDQGSIQFSARPSDVVAFQIAAQDYCVDISAVREIRGWSPTTLLPHAPDYVIGVINLRGSVLAVVDLAARLGLGQTDPDRRNVVIIVSTGGQTVGLLADVVSDILGIDLAAMKPVPEIATESVRRFVSSVITLPDGRLLRKLDLREVLPGPTIKVA